MQGKEQTMEMVHLEPPAELGMPLAEAMFTQRAIRRLDPARLVGDAQLKLVLDAASKAPNGGNVQVARFLVVRDRDRIRAFGKLYHEAWWAKRADDYGWTPDQDLPIDSPYRMAALLAREMGGAPVVVLAFSMGDTTAAAGSVFPAAQNLMLAARALGIGSVLTTLHPSVMERVYTLFDVPDEVDFHCCIPLGYPRGNFGLTRRYPTADTAFWDRWDARPPWG
jgi:nitroreductase